MRKQIIKCLTFTVFFAIGGCASTLFFPTKSAEIAADKVIDDVWAELAKPAAAEFNRP